MFFDGEFVLFRLRDGYEIEIYVSIYLLAKKQRVAPHKKFKGDTTDLAGYVEFETVESILLPRYLL